MFYLILSKVCAATAKGRGEKASTVGTTSEIGIPSYYLPIACNNFGDPIIKPDILI